MAFIRWRGRCAQLLTTVYVGGRSKQVMLTNLHGLSITRSLAEGPPRILKEKTPTEHLDMAVVEQSLRKWASEAKVASHAQRLYDAAGVLTEWRASFYRENELIGKNSPTCYNAP